MAERSFPFSQESAVQEFPFSSHLVELTFAALRAARAAETRMGLIDGEPDLAHHVLGEHLTFADVENHLTDAEADLERFTAVADLVLKSEHSPLVAA